MLGDHRHPEPGEPGQEPGAVIVVPAGQTRQQQVPAQIERHPGRSELRLTWRAEPHDDRQPRAGLACRRDHPAPLVRVERVHLAHHAQDGESGDTGTTVGLDHVGDPGEVERPVVVKDRGHDRVDTFHAPEATRREVAAPETVHTCVSSGWFPDWRPGGGARMRTARDAVGGVVAVAVALGLSELLAGLIRGVPSLVTSVGSVLIPLFPPSIVDWAKQTFGTSDKLALSIGTVVIALAIGAGLGALARRDRSTAAAAIAGFGIVGVLAATRSTGVSVPLVVVATAVSVAAGIAVLFALVSPATVGGREPATAAGSDDGGAGRRRFLALAGAGAAAAVGSAALGRWLAGVRRGGPAPDLSLPAPSRAAPSPAATQAFGGVDGLTPLVVPNDDFYRIDTALVPPDVNPDTWSLKITGMVDREVTLSYDDLLNMELVEGYITIACVSNEVGGDLVGNARWRGVPLRHVLDMAGVQEGATQIVGRSVDGFTVGFPTEVALDGRMAMVAVGMNDAPLPVKHGFPARLLVPGLYGYVSATKWLSEIELTTLEAFDAYWVPRGWAKRAPIKTESRIDVPSNGARVTGPTTVAGVAWAPHRGIARVEIQVDDGPWQACELTSPLSKDAWVQFKRQVDLGHGDHRLRVRATDGDGHTQTADRSPPAPDGATGYHTIQVFAT